MIVERIPLGDQPTPFIDQHAVAYARISDDDAEHMLEINRQAWAAAAEIENYAQIALLFQTIRVTLPNWPGKRQMALPIAPVVEESPLAVTVDGKPVKGASIVGMLRPSLWIEGAVPQGRMVIEYRAGFGEDAPSIPPDLAVAIHDQAKATFEDGSLIQGRMQGMSPHMARIVARYRRVGL